MSLSRSGCSSVPTSVEESLYSSIAPFSGCNPSRNNSCLDDSSICSTFNKNLDFCDKYRVKGKDKVEFGDADEDFLDRLPSDPFGMGIRSAFTAISGWIQNFEEGSGSGSGFFEVDKDQNSMDDHELFSDLNWIWDGATDFQTRLSDLEINGVSLPSESFDVFGIDNVGFMENNNVGEFLTVRNVRNWFFSDEAKGLQDCLKVDIDVEGVAPHEAMFFVLGYLSLQDLLSAEKVCRSLRDTVRSDLLLWKTICVNQPLNVKITDDTLVKLSDRAQGTLQCLNLVGCMRITDIGLKCVFERNPGLMKLSVPNCVKVTIEGILLNLRALKLLGRPGLRNLHIAGLSNVTNQQFEELQHLLDSGRQMHQKPQKPQFYCGGMACQTCDDDRTIDIEMCPRCQKLRVVYDCPAEGCQQNQQASESCRACILCIARCISCGRCIKDRVYKETFFLDLLCLDCWHLFLSCQEEKGSTKCTIISQKTTFHFSLCG